MDIREGTCLPIEDAWTTDIDKITNPQWTRLLQNIDVVDNERVNFMSTRLRDLDQVVTEYNRLNQGRAADLNSIFMGIQDAMANGNLSTFPATNILKKVYDKDMSIYETRATTVENRFQLWQQEYLKCKVGQAQVKVLPNHPVTQRVRGGPISVEQTGMTGDMAVGGNAGQRGGATGVGQQMGGMGVGAGQATGGSMTGQGVGQLRNAQRAGMEGMIGVRGGQLTGQGGINIRGQGRGQGVGLRSRQAGR